MMLFETVERWESWLSENLDHVGVRLQIRRKASNEPGITYDEALDSALCYGWIDGQAKGLDADYFSAGVHAAPPTVGVVAAQCRDHRPPD